MSIRSFTRRSGRCDASACLLTSVFFCMLIAVAATSDDVWIKCLTNNTHQPVQRQFQPADNVTWVTLEMSNRITHQLFTHIFRIILQEKLGYAQVKIREYRDYDAFNITERMECFEQDQEHMAIDKVPTSMINVAVPASLDFTDITHCTKELGTIAPPEQFGWFIPIKYERVLRKWHNDSINVQWSSFNDAKFADKLKLTREDEKYLKDKNYLYQCKDTRCTNGKYIPDWCKDNACATIIAAEFPSTQEVMGHINEMRVYATVLWVNDDKFETTVDYLTARTATTGFVIMSWTPSDVIFDINKFVSVTMKQCDYTGQSKSSGCFYEKRRLAKFAWKDIHKGKETHRIFDTLTAVNIVDQHYRDLLEFYSRNRKRKSTAQMACEWVQTNQKLVNTEWLNLIDDYKPIYIGGIFPITGSAYTGRGIVKGAQMAVNYINEAQILPPGMKLNLLIADGACRADQVMRSFIDYISGDKFRTLLGVLGPACSDTVEPLAGISKYYRTITISYSAEGGLFSDRDKYPYFFRTIGENQNYKYVYLKFFQALGWKRVAALTEDGQKYTEYISHMQNVLENESIKFISNEKFSRERDKDAITKRLEKLKQDGARIIIADVFDEIARQVMCEAHKLEMTAKDGYVWFLPNWLNYTWYDTNYFNQQFNESVNCTTAIMKDAINGYFAMAHAYYGNDDDLMQENISIKQWKMQYQRDKHTNSTSNYSGYAYDAVWVFAYALRTLLKQDPEAIEHIHSLNNTKKLVDIMKHLDFNGVSGEIKFRGGPTRFSVINVMQWYNGNTHIVSRFMPNISDAEHKIVGGDLVLNKSAIVWLSHTQPADGPPAEHCTLHNLAVFMNVSCQTALLITNLVCVLVFLFILGAGIYYGVKRNYDKKMSNTNNYMKSLGLEHLLSSQYTGLDDWEVPKEDIVLNRKLGEGAFGTVHGGEAHIPNIGWTGVAVKTLKLGSSTEERLDFLSEAEVMKRFDHKNVVKLLGVCTKDEPVFTIMEFMLYGDLKTYLLARRHLVNCNDDYDEVSSKRLTSMALDVARGLSYLASLKYVHRDIASRNCLINEQRMVKLCDFGMTRPVANYYKFNRKGMLPVRWMSPESLALGVFTTASDVWSYGVLLYEIITFGSFPYQAMSNSEVLDAVKTGHSLSIPRGVKGPLEALLSKCWCRDPAERPGAADIVIYLAENPRLISPCLDVPISSVQTEEPTDMQMADNFRKVSSSTSFKNLPHLVHDAERIAASANHHHRHHHHQHQQSTMPRYYPKRTVSVPNQCDSGISIQMENCCPKAPLLPPRSDSITEVLATGAAKFAKATSPKRHAPLQESPSRQQAQPQPPLPTAHEEQRRKDYVPFEHLNGHAISKV